MPFPVGIDLGTSTSALSIFREGVPLAVPTALSADASPVVPSVVAWSENRQELVVGERAQVLRQDPSLAAAEFKRSMGTDGRFPLGPRSYSPQELSAVLLRQLCRSASDVVDFPIVEAVISVPATFKDAARQATLDAATIAGLKVPRLIPEPTAAALAFGITHLDVDERLLVFDFGGGTLDITLLQMCDGVIEVERVDGDERLGGKDLDQAILDGVVRRYLARFPGARLLPGAEERARRACQAAKVRLSQLPNTAILLPEFAEWRGDPLPLDVDLSRTEMELLVAPLVDRAVGRLDRLLRAGGRPVDPASVRRVLMVGGTTYMPTVRQKVAEHMGKAVSTEVDPELAVSLGAAVQAAISAGVLSGDGALILADVSPYSVGVEVVQPLRDGNWVPGVFSPLIERNQPIPHRSRHQFSLMHPQQRMCQINVFQGNSKFVAENEVLASAQISDIPAAEGPSPRSLQVDFAYDQSGIASLKITVEGTNCEAALELDPRQGRMGTVELNAARERLEQPVDERARVAQRESQSLLDRARRILLRNGEDARLEQAIAHLEECLRRGVYPSIQSAQDRLVDAILEAEGN